jgi:hypothetical protein
MVEPGNPQWVLGGLVARLRYGAACGRRVDFDAAESRILLEAIERARTACDFDGLRRIIDEEGARAAACGAAWEAGAWWQEAERLAARPRHPAAQAIPPAAQQRIVALVRQEESQVVIARKLGIHANTVYKWVLRLGLARRVRCQCGRMMRAPNERCYVCRGYRDTRRK